MKFQDHVWEETGRKRRILDKKSSHSNLGQGEKSKLTKLCNTILASDTTILSLIISNSEGEVLGRAQGAEYDKVYHKKTANVRSYAGAWGAVIMGIEEKNTSFGRTEYVLRSHARAKILMVPFQRKDFTMSLLIKKSGDPEALVSKIETLLKKQV